MSRSNIHSIPGYDDAGNIIGVAVQESLFLTAQVLNNYSTSQGIENMLLIRVADEATGYMPCKRKE